MITCEYEIENEIPVIYIFSRDEEGKRVVTKDKDFRPYFYCPINEAIKFGSDKRVLNIADTNITDIEGTKLTKIIVKQPKFMKELKKEVTKSFEADISYPIRYMIDKYNDIQGVPLSVSYIDIETNSNNIFPNTSSADDEITAITSFNNMSGKCITFVWRADQEERIVNNGTKSFKTESGDDFRYTDYTLFFDNERKMLMSFIKYIQDSDPDMFTGWNVKEFDMLYIINRMNNLGMDYTQLSPMKMAMTNEYGDVIIKGRIIFDMLEGVKKMMYGEMESFALDNVALAELGEQKIPRPIKNGKEISHGEFWKTNLNLFIEYNKKDVMLVYQIQKKKQIIQNFDEVRRMAKCSFNDVFQSLKVVDSFVLSFCKNKIIMPSKIHNEKELYGGGKVLKPKKGIHEWVPVFDFKSLYPKIISSINASPETITMVGDEKTVNLKIPYIDYTMFYKEVDGKRTINKAPYNKAKEVFEEYFESQWNLLEQKFKIDPPVTISKYISYKEVHFKQNKKGFIPSILEYLFDQRIKIQKERDTYEYGSPEYIRLEFKQFAFKVMMNSFYGVLGHHGFRLYRPEIAAAITFIGRNAVLWNKFVSQQNGYDVLYGDTDSTFIPTINPVTRENMQPGLDEGIKIQDFLQKSYDDLAKTFNMKKHYFLIEFEKMYERIFFGNAKKRYAGVLAWYKGKEANKMGITGFEVVRTDQSRIARQTQEKVFNMLLKDKLSKTEIVSYVRDIMKNIKDNKYTYEELGIPTPLKKALSDYKTNIPAVRGVIYSNKYLGLDIRPGEKFLLIYVNNIPGMPKTDVIAIRENMDFPNGGVIDYVKHSDEATKEKMEKIFDGLGWSLLDLKGQGSCVDY